MACCMGAVTGGGHSSLWLPLQFADLIDPIFRLGSRIIYTQRAHLQPRAAQQAAACNRHHRHEPHSIYIYIYLADVSARQSSVVDGVEAEGAPLVGILTQQRIFCRSERSDV